jgi:hypothetical protein
VFESAQLTATFVNGAIYQYDGIPLDEYNTFMAAESKGSYFSKHISRKFNYTKL